MVAGYPLRRGADELPEKSSPRYGCSITTDELHACFELGFNFDSQGLDPKLSSTFPALEFYYTVNRRYSLCRSSSAMFFDSDTASSSVGSPSSIVDPGDDPATVKARLKQWPQVAVVCSCSNCRRTLCDCCLFLSSYEVDVAIKLL